MTDSDKLEMVAEVLDAFPSKLHIGGVEAAAVLRRIAAALPLPEGACEQVVECNTLSYTKYRQKYGSTTTLSSARKALAALRATKKPGA